MDAAERAELIAARVTVATASEQLLTLTETVLGVSGEPVELSPQELTDARSQAADWREQLEVLRVRIASLTVEPPDRPQ